MQSLGVYARIGLYIDAKDCGKGTAMKIKRHETGSRITKAVIHGDTVYLAGIVADSPKEVWPSRPEAPCHRLHKHRLRLFQSISRVSTPRQFCQPIHLLSPRQVSSRLRVRALQGRDLIMTPTVKWRHGPTIQYQLTGSDLSADLVPDIAASG